MSSATVGYAIVGTGMIAAVHARALATVTGARLVAVVSRNAERGAAFAAEHGAARVVAAVEDLAGSDDVEVVIVTTPSGAHLEPALAAIAQGRHLVVEKPLEVSLARVDEMLAAADAAGVRVMPIFQQRFSAGAQAAKAAVAAGRLGRLTLAGCHVQWYRNTEYYTGSPWKGTRRLDGGGALMNQGIHGVDLLQWLVGVPVEVSARTTRRLHEGIEVEDTAVAHLRWADGALGTIAATTAMWPGWSLRIELGGTTGSIRLEDGVITAWDFAEAQPGDGEMTGGVAELGSGAANPGGISLAGHARQLTEMTAAVRERRAPGLAGVSGRAAVAVIEAIYASAASGRVTPVG